ncbi:MAG: hypothetical protein ABFC92_06505 [Rectinema sp.]|nr:hypothetical protein [Spirochaetaceae bacterium]
MKRTFFRSKSFEVSLVAAIVIIVASLLIFVIYPIVEVFLFPKAGDFLAVLKNPRYMKTLQNRRFMMILSTLSATFLGFVFAYTVTRTDVPGRKAFKLISLLPLFPSRPSWSPSAIS